VATTSPLVIDYIRKNIGFDGLLMSDDLSMKALQGSYAEKATSTLKAGCDLVLHCNGKMEEMTEVAKGTSAMNAEALRRANAAWAKLPAPHIDTAEIAAMRAKLANFMASVA
jgi:beta-N-acetylhexosaminidase